MELGDQGDRGPRIDPTKAAQPRDRFPVGGLLGEGGQLLIEASHPLLDLLDPGDVVRQRHLVGCVLERQALKPRAIGLPPRTPGERIEACAAHQEGGQAMTGAQQIPACVLAATAQVAHRFVGRRGRAHHGEIVGSQQSRQLVSIPPVGLDALARLDRDQRGRHHLADHTPRGLELAHQHVAAGARLVAAPHFSRRLTLELLAQPPDRGRLIGHLPLHRLQLTRQQHRHVDRLLVSVHPYEGDTLRAHDGLLSYAALAPLALTRDRGWPRATGVGLSSRRWHDLTTASPSFHMVSSFHVAVQRCPASLTNPHWPPSRFHTARLTAAGMWRGSADEPCLPGRCREVAQNFCFSASRTIASEARSITSAMSLVLSWWPSRAWA